MFLFSAGGNSSHVLSDGDVKYLVININMRESNWPSTLKF